MVRIRGFQVRNLWSVNGRFDWKMSAKNAGIGLLVSLFVLAFWLALPNAAQQFVSIAGLVIALFFFLQALPVVVLGFAAAMILDRLIPELFPYLVPTAQSVMDTFLPQVSRKMDADLLLQLFAVSLSIAFWWSWQAQPVLLRMMYNHKSTENPAPPKSA